MTVPTDAQRLSVVPLSFKEACAVVERLHRHHNKPQGHKFSLGVRTPDHLVGVAIVGRPVARPFDNGLTVEVTRVATDGTPNACSALYAAAWRTARSAGYRRAITYTQDGESGASLRAAGWSKVADLPARTGWDTPSRPRRTLGTEHTARTLWEITTHNAPPLPDLRNEIRNAIRCAADDCTQIITPRSGPGRPALYCSPACRLRAHRHRKGAHTP